MNSPTPRPPPPTESSADSHTTFFRQSSWLVVANVSGGFLMVATQVIASRWMSTVEYGVWFTLLRIYLLMSVPSVGLQTIFVQQTAAAVTERQQHELANTVRAVLQATLGFWLILAGVAWFSAGHWIRLFKITNPAALWITVLIGLAALWTPMIRGVLQGRQQFLGLGWVMILDGLGRFVAVAVILLLGGEAAGGLAGALIGQVLSLALGAWLVRGILLARGEPVRWRPWLRRVIPLTLCVGSVQFMGNFDVVYLQGVLPAEVTSLGYFPAAMIGLALVTFSTPLVAVMFPKVVRSAALSQSTRALRHALVATALIGGIAALVCTAFPWLPLRLIYLTKPAYWGAAPLVPWFAWGLLPLILANVLIGNLLARERFAVVPWAAAIAVGYGLTLFLLRQYLPTVPSPVAFRIVVGALAGFSLLLLVTAAVFTGRQAPADPATAT